MKARVFIRTYLSLCRKTECILIIGGVEYRQLRNGRMLAFLHDDNMILYRDGSHGWRNYETDLGCVPFPLNLACMQMND